MALSRSNSRKVETAFAIYLRTGYRAAPGVELKFNPWHDTGNGRFTFVGQGRYYQNGSYQDRDAERGIQQRDRDAGAKDIHDAYGGRRVPSARDPYVPDYGDASPWHPANWKVYTVGPGDSLTSIARMRKGLTVKYLADFNRIPIGKLRIGQTLMLPTQRALDEGRDARSKFMALALYMGTHGGQMPPNRALPSVAEQISATYRKISANGYLYELDLADRFKRVTGTLTRNRAQGRSRKAQELAGGSDRLPKDHGGHVIARRFNGPKDWFNHFAQDGSFNQTEYAALERSWDKAMDAGHTVRIDIRASYEGISRRPSWITAYYWFDGERRVRRFPNVRQRKTP
ncbi:DNA/RNA non-specific endonuclease [Sphingomonas sp. KR3-1]|uniref:LysM peptidoglycan-binding domain-containing protein n=1 Tax=Sphingomonas sp. KR3-1 TaxID=3156611 RepID=UPI0032B4BE70